MTLKRRSLDVVMATTR